MTQLITIGVGQCGTQTAASFTDIYMNEASNYVVPEASQRIFYEQSDNSYVARAVLIDTESKAVEDIIQDKRSPKNWTYDRRSIYAQGSGSRNNWAYGYSNNGFKYKTEVMDRLQHQTEKCDRFGGFLMFQSLAGGTGSGLGSRVTETVRDFFGSKAHIVNNVVWPYKSGEVVVQSYNSVLSLACLLKHSDAVCVTYNDVLHSICAETHGEENVSFNDMNAVIGRSLAHMLLPSNGVCDIPLWSQPLMHLTSMPSRKLLSTFTLPIISDKSKQFTTFSWDTLVDNAVAMAATANYAGKNVASLRRLVDSRSTSPLKCDSLWMILRGVDIPDARSKAAGCPMFSSSRFFSSDNTDPLLVSASTRSFSGLEKSVSILANSQAIIDPLEGLLTKCHAMFESGAFLYQYLESGVTKEWINEDRLFLEKVLNEYKSM